MKAWLIALSPSNSFWDLYVEGVLKTNKDKTAFLVQLDISDPLFQKNDRVFLCKKGLNGGVLASGIIVSDTSEGSKTSFELDWVSDETCGYLSLDPIGNLNGFLQSDQPCLRLEGSNYAEIEKRWAAHIGVENDVYHLLQASDDIVPENYDGTYILAKRIAQKFAEQGNYDQLNFNDLDLLYAASTSQQSDKRIRTVLEGSSFPEPVRQEILQLAADLFQRSEQGQFEHISQGTKGMGMFSPGFNTFKRGDYDNATPGLVIRIIATLASLDSELDPYSAIDNLIPTKIPGVNVSSFSAMAHCVRPFDYPVMNANEGHGNIYGYLKEDFGSIKNLRQYVQFSKKLNEYKKAHFSFQNFRVMDLVARQIPAVDFNVIFNALTKYGGKPYSKPENESDPQIAEELKKARKTCQEGNEEFKKLCNILANELSLDCFHKSKWSDGSGRFINGYYWGECHSALQDEGDPISLSFFASKDLPNIQVSGIRVAIEINDSHASPDDYERLKRVMTMPLPEGFCYVVGTDQSKNASVSNEPTDVLLGKWQQGEITKIQLSKMLPYDKDVKAIEYYREILKFGRQFSTILDYILTGAPVPPIEDKPTANGDMIMIGYNKIYYGIPGCGKSYIVENDVLKGVPEDRVFRTTFYQDYSYTDFVGQLMPETKTIRSEEGKNERILSYDFRPGPFTEALKKAHELEPKFMNPDPEKFPSDYMVYLVVEEINRGNAPSIFGDLFQLLDRFNDPADKTKYGWSQYPITNKLLSEELKVQGKIAIPPNLVIIGTMNTSDQNVFTLDTAFKRRWLWEEVKNDFANHKYADYYIPGTAVKWSEFVEKINEKIIMMQSALSGSEDKRLGAYFVSKQELTEIPNASLDDEDVKAAAKRFAYKVLEYLWDDVVKFHKGEMFEPNYRILSEVIEGFLNPTVRLGVFAKDIGF